MRLFLIICVVILCSSCSLVKQEQTIIEYGTIKIDGKYEINAKSTLAGIPGYEIGRVFRLTGNETSFDIIALNNNIYQQEVVDYHKNGGYVQASLYREWTIYEDTSSQSCLGVNGYIIVKQDNVPVEDFVTLVSTMTWELSFFQNLPNNYGGVASLGCESVYEEATGDYIFLVDDYIFVTTGLAVVASTINGDTLESAISDYLDLTDEKLGKRLINTPSLIFTRLEEEDELGWHDYYEIAFISHDAIISATIDLASVDKPDDFIQLDQWFVDFLLRWKETTSIISE